MKHPGKTAPFRGPGGEIVPGSIAEAKYLRLGGLDQWVLIRGESLANPPLILLHGGPGFSETHFFRRFLAPLEKSFTLVYWDQRGSGKSFDRKIPRASLTVDQFVADLDALVQAVCTRVGKSRVVLFGHSWGSALGVLYAARFPDKVAAYVGSGQIGDWSTSDATSYAFTLAEAQRLNNRKAIRELSQIGSPPYSANSFWKQRTWLNRLEGQMSLRAVWNLGKTFFSATETSILDIPNLLSGFRFSLETMWEERSRTNLIQAAPVLEIPVFFFLGRHDHWVPSDTSVAYFDKLTAPSKTIVWFEKSGHEPFVDEPRKFNALMIELVRPAVAPNDR